MKTLIAAVALGVAWLTRRERNPARWPRMLRDDVTGVVEDAREALVDGAQAGRRMEHAFDADLDAVRKNARTW